MKKSLIIAIIAMILFPLIHHAKADDFSDIHSIHINKEAVEYLQSNSVVEGYEDGSYKPENRINRAEFVKIIIASQVQNPWGNYCFTDVKNEWFAKYICTAKRLGYIKGHPDGTFKPGDYINFAEASQIVSKALSVTPDATGTQGEWYAGYVNGLAQQKAIPSTVQFFDKDLSRGEMAEVVWRLKESVTDKVSQDYEAITQEFPAIKSCAALKEKFATHQSFQYRYGYLEEDIMFTGERADMEGEAAVPMMAKSEASAEDFSTTNIQVAGVDEADIIKNDGKYIYMIKGDTIRIIEAYPPNTMEEVTELDFDDEYFRPREMYVKGDQLVVIGGSWEPYYPVPLSSSIMPPRPWWRGYQTRVYILDITDRNNPKEERKVTFDGNYHTSRLIKDHVYLVLNERPNVWIWDDVREGKDLLPYIQDGDKEAEPMVGCADIRYFPSPIQPNYLITASIPLDDPSGEIDSEVFLGSGNNVYASRTHLYVATNEVNYDYYTDWDWRRDRTHTLVFKFALEDGDINYIDRGRVPGRILNQFSMDANIDHFRIATTIDSWNPDSPSGNNVYVMDKSMAIVGQIEDIAPGERIFSTRFLGDRLYMVTFERVDPLFVIDLEDPANPKILGKLKIPGFSDYLHPFGKNHIIGFGKDTEEDKYGNVLMKGFKMSLFDVSDVENPIQKFTEYIGDRGTDSELLRNHKALLFDKNKELLAFPIRIQEKITPEELGCEKYRYSTCPGLCYKRCIPSSCTEDAEGRAVCTDDCEGLGSCTAPNYERYTTTFSGAVVYTLNEDEGFNQRGRITHYNDEDILKMGDYWPYNYEKNIQRIIYIGDYLYTISQSKIKASDMDDTDEVNALDLN